MDADSWWGETDAEILRLVGRKSPIAPAEIAREMGISEGEATAALCMLAREGKLRIRLVEAVPTSKRQKQPAAA